MSRHCMTPQTEASAFVAQKISERLRPACERRGVEKALEQVEQAITEDCGDSVKNFAKS